MCVGENSALHAIAYLNAQLQALWNISSECVARHDNYMKPEPGHRYSYSLTEWYFGTHCTGRQASVEDMMFHARFEAPRLDFLCNHEALLKVNIEEGHYNLDHADASDETTADRSRNRSIAPSSTFTFRVPFKMTGIKGRDSKIGNGEIAVSMVVLDLRHAKLTKVIPEIGSGRQAIEAYLHNYLYLLQSAGHHVLFSLPNFDDAGLRPYLDFSQIAYRLLGIDDIHGVAIEQINRYLSATWLNALILANKQPIEYPAVSLAEYRSTWCPEDGDIHFHLNFGAPYIAALCDDEVLVYFVLDDVRFYDTGDFETSVPFKTYTNWKIAVLMNVIHEKADNDNITRCRLDLASALLMQQFSEFDGCRFDDDEEDGRCMNQIVDFISGEYLNFLESGQYHIIYHHDARSPHSTTIYGQAEQHEDLDIVDEAEWASPGAEEVSDQKDSKINVWRDIAQNSDMCGFDEISALSQLSINRQFRSAWSEQQSTTTMTADRMLTRWRYQDRFEATFEPLTIRLRPDGRAIIFINLSEGFLIQTATSLPNSQADREKHSFTGWQVAFSVDIKMCDHIALSDTSPEWLAQFAQSAAYKQYGDSPNVKLTHIYLDFECVEFLHEASRFEGLFTSNSSRSMNKVLAVVTYLRDHYLKRFVQFGHHVLYTIPVWKNSATAPPHGLTNVAFHVYSKTAASTSDLSATQQRRISTPVIVILGMCGGRSPPASILQPSTDWVAHAGKFWSHGTGSISGAVFLRERLLPLLSEVNAATTVIPTSSVIEHDKWKLDLNSWSKNSQRIFGDCPFTPVSECTDEGVLRYQWDYQDQYNYDLQGGVRSVFSRTMNYLEIPTVFQDGVMEIKLGGRVDLELSAKTRNSWSSKGFSAWTTSLVVKTEAGGLRVSVLSVPTQFHREQTRSSPQSALILNPADLLRRTLPSSIDLADVVKSFQLFESTWQFCYPRSGAYSPAHPVFNCRGDLLFELRLQPQAPRMQQQTPRPQPQALPPAATTGRTARGTTNIRGSTVRGRGGTHTTRTEHEVRHENSTTFNSGPEILRVEVNATGTHPFTSMPNGWYTSTETTSYSEGAASDSPFGFFTTSPPVSSTFSATTTDSTTSSHHASPAPPFIGAAHAQPQQFSETVHTRARSAAGMHQRAASAASVRPPSAASSRQQDRLNSTFAVTGDGIRVHTTLQPEDIPDSGSSSAHTPRVQPFGIPDIYGQGMPQNIVEALNRAAEMSSPGRTTTTTTTTSHRATPPQIRTVRPIPVDVGLPGAHTSFRESMQTSGGMNDEMGGSSMLGDMFDSRDLNAHFGGMGIRSVTPGRTRAVFSGMTSGGTGSSSTSSTTSMSSEEYFRASSRSRSQFQM